MALMELCTMAPTCSNRRRGGAPHSDNLIINITVASFNSQQEHRKMRKWKGERAVCMIYNQLAACPLQKSNSIIVIKSQNTTPSRKVKRTSSEANKRIKAYMLLSPCPGTNKLTIDKNKKKNTIQRVYCSTASFWKALRKWGKEKKASIYVWLQLKLWWCKQVVMFDHLAKVFS